ncbi:hypothetical protein BKA70DRAFT_725827 [Coprinopsis sp. MPI-PUGE-AT-0042]|nr:hypothetical protein BKA70DRAFT_725827 [Coprinopsis sp. MPI-PUGE-AT-0042]
MVLQLKRRLARTAQKPSPPLQALPIPLDVAYLIIDNHLAHDIGTLKALSLACRPLLAYCRAILFRYMEIGRWRDPKLAHNFSSEFSPCNILDLVMDLQITFPSFSFFPPRLSRFMHTLGIDRYHRLVKPWLRFLAQSSFPRLKTLRVRFRDGPLPAKLQGVLIQMLERSPSLSALDLKTSKSPSVLPILFSGAAFAAIVHLRVSAEVWSAFYSAHVAIEKQAFPMLKALDILGRPEDSVLNHPSPSVVGSSTLYHLEFTNLNSHRNPFGLAHNLILEVYSQTLQCLHIDIQWLTMENLVQHRSEAYYPIALHNLPHLEYFEISLSGNPNILPSTFTWISNMLAHIPMPSLPEAWRRLKIVILLHRDTLSLYDEEVLAFVEWAGEGIFDYSIRGDRWPKLRMVRLSVYICDTYPHSSPMGRWCRCRTPCASMFHGPYTLEGNTWPKPSVTLGRRSQLNCKALRL